MNEYFSKAIEWIKANKILAAVIGLALGVFLLPRILKKLKPRRRRRRSYAVTTRRHRRPATRHYGIKRKRPWQIKGSLAARRHMARIRRRK